MTDTEAEIEQALEHINAALQDTNSESMQNQWVLKQAQQALKLELWHSQGEDSD